MDPLIVLLAVVMSVLTVLLVIVGVQVILILKQFRETLDHVNRSLRSTDEVIGFLSTSITGLGSTVVGLKSGLKLAETFALWVKEQGHKDGRPLS